MPELPEVERAAALIREHAVGKLIHHVDTFDDSLVFSGFTHQEFAREITGRMVEDAARYGKCFYIQLQGSGRTPVLHFGMTGALQVRDNHVRHDCFCQTRFLSSATTAPDTWPPRFVKFILYIQDGNSAAGFTEIAFSDARRLGRIRLELGFDPVLSMPSLEDFHASLCKRTCPIKSLLLDQAFSAGVGNYLADEILYQARVHPDQRCGTLDRDQVIALHHHVADVCRIAVQANADDSKYPEHWLFKHRWRKGKNVKTPSGEPATIKWITVGGRTSAYVPEVQKLPSSRGHALNSTAV
ncbi:Formamidopyrimidine-DNA glycosylase N-terminal domain-containing protein [Pisolithus sp. B1]|nr:Formamidopyrimidine-DNA glycosylase N-terminal domain-containing protein [Pisolithus sp. B1]